MGGKDGRVHPESQLRSLAEDLAPRFCTDDLADNVGRGRNKHSRHLLVG